MKKLICFLFLILAGCYFLDSFSDFLEPKFKGKAYIVNTENSQEGSEKIRSEIRSFGMVCDEFKTKTSAQASQHKEIWRKIVENNEMQAVIFEDNVQFEKYFKRNFQRYVQDLPQDWDIAFLVIGRENDRYGYFVSVGDVFRDIDEVKGHPYVAEIQKTNKVYGLYGYIINKKGAEKLLKITENISEDLGKVVFQKGGINTGYIKAYVSMFKLLEPKLVKTEETVRNRAVNKFKEIIKTNNPAIIANHVRYPFLQRCHKLNIKEKNEFIKKYELIFDDNIRNLITNSELKDWDTVGSRGIMLFDGDIWINENAELLAINRSTQKAKNYIEQWHKNDRNTLYVDLKQYKRNIFVFETSSKLVRVDEMEDGFRLAFWKKEFDMSTKPEVVMLNGKWKPEGIGGNSAYLFKDGHIEYRVDDIVMAKDPHPFELKLKKNDEILWEETGEEILPD